jgi:hypothetical protein
MESASPRKSQFFMVSTTPWSLLDIQLTSSSWSE